MNPVRVFRLVIAMLTSPAWLAALTSRCHQLRLAVQPKPCPAI